MSVNLDLQQIVIDFEKYIRRKKFIVHIENHAEISFYFKTVNLPHLLGIGYASKDIRVVKGKSAKELYDMMKVGYLTFRHLQKSTYSNLIFKKAYNFQHMVQLLQTNEIIEIIQSIGKIKAQYLLTYRQKNPRTQVLHLGLAWSETGYWYPETFLVLGEERQFNKYTDNQLVLKIEKIEILDRIPTL